MAASIRLMLIQVIENATFPESSLVPVNVKWQELKTRPFSSKIHNRLLERSSVKEYPIVKRSRFPSFVEDKQHQRPQNQSQCRDEPNVSSNG